MFSMPHPEPDTPKLLVCNRLQETIRKNAERLNAVMQSRFNGLLRPAHFRTAERMINTGRTVAVLHNMAMECTRAGFLARRRVQGAPQLGRLADELALKGAD